MDDIAHMVTMVMTMLPMTKEVAMGATMAMMIRMAMVMMMVMVGSGYWANGSGWTGLRVQYASE